MDTRTTNITDEIDRTAQRQSMTQTRHAVALVADTEATGRLFQAMVWGYFGTAAGMLVLALAGLSGAHIHWVHLARGIVTGS